MAARVKPGSLGAPGQDGEPPGHGRRLMGVAAEGQCLAAGLVPPPHDHGRQRHGRVGLQCPAGAGQGGQDGAVLVLERGGVEGPARCGQCRSG